MKSSLKLIFMLLLASVAYSQIIVTLSASTTTICTGGSAILTATITNAPPSNQTLNWSFVGTPFGTLSAATGTSVTYTAPVTTQTQTVTIQVSSAADQTKFQQVTLQILGCISPPSPTAFVTRLYNGFLGRAPDTNGLNYWASQVPPMAQVVLAFYSSAEFQQNGAIIIKTYIAALGRDPDFAGFSYWRSALQNGLSQQVLLNLFLASPEFTQTYGGLTDTGFVILVYQNVLGRPADANGLNYWIAQLGAGLSRAQVMQAFVNSTEFAAFVNNRLLADTAYLTLLNQTPDVQGRVFWTNQLNLGITQLQIFNSFITSPEFVNSFY